MDEVTPDSTEGIDNDITTTSLSNVFGNLLRSGTEPSLWRCGGGRGERENGMEGGLSNFFLLYMALSLYRDSVMHTHITNTLST